MICFFSTQRHKDAKTQSIFFLGILATLRLCVEKKYTLLKWMILLTTLFSADLSAEIKMLAFSGSTREGSFNKQLIQEAASIAGKMGINATVIDLKNYQTPFYDADLEMRYKMPENAKALRNLMKQSEVILIASPEYNASVSAVLKNALDWASRSEDGSSSREAFKGKTFVLMSASPGRGGGARGLIHLKAIIEDVGGTIFPKQFVVPNAYTAFDEQGHLRDPKLQMELQHIIQGLK